MVQICDLKQCTGCFACMNGCPTEAIKVTTDDMGKTIPKIDSKKCIDCGLCQKICQVNHPGEMVSPNKCYATWTKVSPDRNECASGGVATGFARKILETGGVIFGAKFEEEGNLNLRMVAGESAEQIELFRGSKYVQSFTGRSYQEAKKALKNGRQVLYIGTPCQIDGLNHFLQMAYDNLITVDIICHGVPPIRYLKEYGRVACPKKALSTATFRGKHDFMMCFYEENQLVYKRENQEDIYFHSFLKGLSFRDNCYQCQYAQSKRIADITIGDFWGLDKSTLKTQYDGRISAVLINTKKGEKFFQSCDKFFEKEERSLDEAIRGNDQLKHPSIPHKDREIFERTYRAGGFVKAIQATAVYKEIQSNRNSKKIPYKIIRKIGRWIKKDA